MGQATEKQRKYAKVIAETLEIDLPKTITFESLRDFINDNNASFKQKQKMNEKQEAQEIRDKIVRSISILDYAQELGFTLVRKGKYYSLKEHDSVMIEPNKNCFWRNSEKGDGRSIGKGDSVIGFAKMFSGMSMEDIMKDFSNRVKDNDFVVENCKKSQQFHNSKINKGVFTLPEASTDMRRVFAYLTKSRMIDPDIVQEMVDRKFLYQSKERGNCVFVSYDEEGKACAACLRGTNTERRFIGDVEYSDYDKGFYINNQAEKVIITESYIDAMSIMSIFKAQGIHHKDYNYMPLAGAAKLEAVCNLLEKNPQDVLCAFDSDEGGRKNCNILKGLLQEKDISVFISEHFPTNAKDWNEELQMAFLKMKVGSIDFFQQETVEVSQKNEVCVQEKCNLKKDSAMQRALNKRAAEKEINTKHRDKGIEL